MTLSVSGIIALLAQPAAEQAVINSERKAIRSDSHIAHTQSPVPTPGFAFICSPISTTTASRSGQEVNQV